MPRGGFSSFAEFWIFYIPWSLVDLRSFVLRVPRLPLCAFFHRPRLCLLIKI